MMANRRQGRTKQAIGLIFVAILFTGVPEGRSRMGGSPFKQS